LFIYHLHKLAELFREKPRKNGYTEKGDTFKIFILKIVFKKIKE